MTLMRRFVTLLFILVISACQSTPTETTHTERPQYVVLISLDGFRHDYIDKHDAKHLQAIADKGVRAERMNPVYPANTFPNHLSIITGLRPINHGIVANHFYDKSRHASYDMGKGYGDSTWLSGTPLWNLVEQHGFKAATYFWPESDARINGMLPTYHYHYSKYADYGKRVDQIIDWLALPEAQRPRFVAGYFSLTDTQGHEYGPDAKETYEAVQVVDAYIGELYERLQALPIDVNLVVVSDHGMTSTGRDAAIDVGALPISDKFHYEIQGAQVLLYAKDGATDADIAEQKRALGAVAANAYTVLSDAQRAARYYSVNDRTGDIVIQAQAPAWFAKPNSDYISNGGHGYEPTSADMGATFVAIGPAFKQGLRLPAIDNLAVYPTLAKVLGLTLLTPVDGKVGVLAQGLVNP